MLTYALSLHNYLQSLHHQFSDLKEGNVADYIPELSKADPEWFAITLVTVDGQVYQVGDSREQFTIQSASKPFVFGMALEDQGVDAVSQLVNTEPTGEAFNRISLEHHSGRPRNPMINAGAITMSSAVAGDESKQRINRILEKFALFTGHSMEVDDEVYRSEKNTGHRNRAIAHLLLNAGIIKEDPDEVLDVYFQQCAIKVNCRDLAIMGATLANQGVNPVTGVRAMKAEMVPRVLSVMVTCGMYDGSGEWMYKVGMPAKSGVGGGIVAVLPGKFGMAVFSPRLDRHGNSVRGMRVFEKVSSDLNLHTLNVERFHTSSVIRAVFNGAQVRSKRVRDPSSTRYLDTHGDSVQVIELHGEMMFAAAEIAVSEARRYIPEADFLILDLRRVFSMDTAGAQMMVWLEESMREEGKQLYITGTGNKYAVDRFIKKHLAAEFAAELLRFDAMDEALEWCENAVLERAGEQAGDDVEIGLAQHPLCWEMTEAEIHCFLAFTKQSEYDAGDYICRQGDSGEIVYLILQGSVQVNLPMDGGKHRCVARFSAGSSFGEQSFLEGGTRTADILAETRVRCLELKAGDLNTAQGELPGKVREKLMTGIALDLSRKLRLADREIRYLVS